LLQIATKEESHFIFSSSTVQLLNANNENALNHNVSITNKLGGSLQMWWKRGVTAILLRYFNLLHTVNRNQNYPLGYHKRCYYNANGIWEKSFLFTEMITNSWRHLHSRLYTYCRSGQSTLLFCNDCKQKNADEIETLIWGQEQEVRFWGDSSIRKSKRSKITLQDCR
jgi:hypothetical protein